MNEKLLKKEYLRKILELQKYNLAYYDKSSPIITDSEYDKLKKEIIDLEKEYNFLKSDSERQETLIITNEIKIDSLSSITRRLQIDNDTQDKKIQKFSTDLYKIVK